VLGILAFAGLGICVRWFQHSFCKLHPAIDRGTQEAYITIIAQVGFCLSILIALLITGISLSGLAFIAGGLSVGIGFGLQNIISNFISGLILLIERPIKPGDRIMVGNTEGFVKKISVRSTQITTTTMADVIVPNSDLISQQVTNFVFHNTRMKTALRIHVAPENDIYKVKDILLQIANTQSEVVKEISDHPTVVLLNFDHKGLVFELELTLHDVNRLSTVRSNINFDIIKAFRAQHIELASEQIDIFIKEIP